MAYSVNRPDFPHEIGTYVIEFAREFGHPEAVRQVEQIRDFLGGDPGRMRELSDGWNAIETVNEQHTGLTHDNANIAGTWEGPAYQAFNTHLAAVTSAMETTIDAMGRMSVLLGDMIVRINEQFRTLINFLGDCARDLAEATTGVIDWVAAGATNGLSLVLVVTRILGGFVDNVAAVVGDAMVYVAQFQSAAQEVKVVVDEIRVPEPLPAAADSTGQWTPLMR